MSPVTLPLDTATQPFRMTLPHDNAPPNCVCLQKVDQFRRYFLDTQKGRLADGDNDFSIPPVGEGVGVTDKDD